MEFKDNSIVYLYASRMYFSGQAFNSNLQVKLFY